jgi:hypothetical protein
MIEQVIASYLAFLLKEMQGDAHMKNETRNP